MILDAASLDRRGRRDAARRGRAVSSCPAAEDGALRLGRRAEHRSLRRRDRRGRGARDAAAHGAAAAARERARRGLRRHAPVRAARGAAARRRGALRELVAYAGVSARRQGVQGLHVHLGMPSGADCWQVLEGMLPWLPLVLALSANSPWLAGVATRARAPNRAPILAELPRAGAPPVVRLLRRLGGVGRAARRARGDRRLHADLVGRRPHPRFGTLEVRMPDQPTALRRTALLVALLQALAARCSSAACPPRCDRGHYAQNRWAAARFGRGRS